MTGIAGSLRKAAAVVVGVTLALSVGLATGPLTPAAHAGNLAFTPLSAFDQHLVEAINKARAAHGLSRLQIAAGTTDVAHGWSCHMAESRDLLHNHNLADQLENHGSFYWTMYSENVAEQRASLGAAALFKAYMKSPEHRVNILDPSARFVGLWSKKSDGVRFNTIDFVGSTSSSYDNGYGEPRRTC